MSRPERGRGCPVPVRARPAAAPRQGPAQPLGQDCGTPGKTCLRKDEMPQSEEKKSERNGPAEDDQRREEGRRSCRHWGKDGLSLPRLPCSPKSLNREKVLYQPKSKSHQPFPWLSRKDCLGGREDRASLPWGSSTPGNPPHGGFLGGIPPALGSAPDSPSKPPRTVSLSGDRKQHPCPHHP